MLKTIRKIFKVESAENKADKEIVGANQCDYEEIMRPKPQSEKLFITVASTAHFVLYAASCAVDHRNYLLDLGIIDLYMDDWEVIAIVLAHYVFNGFEENFSPKMVSSFLENYCVEDIKKHFMFYYMHIAGKHGIDVNIENFDTSDIIAIMDIEGLARDHGERLNLKAKHNPFKEPLRLLWIKHLS